MRACYGHKWRGSPIHHAKMAGRRQSTPIPRPLPKTRPRRQHQSCYSLAKGLNCADLKTGKILKTGGSLHGGGSAPCAGDGRFFSGTAMTNADPASLEPMGAVRGKELGLAYECSSTYADGRLYYRTRKNVACIDLRKTPKPAPAPSAPKATVTEATATPELEHFTLGCSHRMRTSSSRPTE